MKKLMAFWALGMFCCGCANADSIIVVDSNGYVTKQLLTVPSTFEVSPAVGSTTTTTTTTTTITTATANGGMPAMAVVRESPVVNNSYYYDRDATNAALAAGVTTAVVGGILFDGFHHRRYHRGWHYPRPYKGRPGHGHRR